MRGDLNAFGMRFLRSSIICLFFPIHLPHSLSILASPSIPLDWAKKDEHLARTTWSFHSLRGCVSCSFFHSFFVPKIIKRSFLSPLPWSHFHFYHHHHSMSLWKLEFDITARGTVFFASHQNDIVSWWERESGKEQLKNWRMRKINFPWSTADFSCSKQDCSEHLDDGGDEEGKLFPRFIFNLCQMFTFSTRRKNFEKVQDFCRWEKFVRFNFLPFPWAHPSSINELIW